MSGCGAMRWGTACGLLKRVWIKTSDLRKKSQPTTDERIVGLRFTEHPGRLDLNSIHVRVQKAGKKTKKTGIIKRTTCIIEGHDSTRFSFHAARVARARHSESYTNRSEQGWIANNRDESRHGESETAWAPGWHNRRARFLCLCAWVAAASAEMAIYVTCHVSAAV